MTEFAFLMEKPNGSRTEYRTSGNDLSPQEAVSRAYDRYPNATIVRKLYGDDLQGVGLENPNDGDVPAEDDPTDAESDDSSTENEMSSTDSADSTEGSLPAPPIDPAAFNVAEVQEKLADDEEYDWTVQNLEALKVSEQGGQDRKTVNGAIDDKLAALEAE